MADNSNSDLGFGAAKRIVISGEADQRAGFNRWSAAKDTLSLDQQIMRDQAVAKAARPTPDGEAVTTKLDKAP